MLVDFSYEKCYVVCNECFDGYVDEEMMFLI